MPSTTPSLKATALRLLAQREHSVCELRTKLLRRAARLARSDAAPPADGEEVDALIDWLVAHGHLSEARFAESRVHARSPRFGNLRIRRELARHGVRLAPDAAAELEASELDRATALWKRKYAAAPADARERARQARFLAGRGFSPEVIGQLLRRGGAAEDESGG